MNLTLSLHEVVLRVQDPLRLPAFKGSSLRGSFGLTLKRICCYHDYRTCAARPPECRCAYGFLFEPKNPAPGSRIQAGEEISRPFVIEPPLEAKTDYQPGETLSFRLLLFGRAQDFLPYFLVAFRELPAIGLRDRRGRVALEEVWAVQDLAGVKQRVYQSADRIVHETAQSVSFEDLAAAAVGYPRDRLALGLETSTRLQYQSRPVRRLEFHILVSSLLRRVEALAALYGEPPAEPPVRLGGWHPRDLIGAAREVALVEDHTRWVELERYSGRQQQKVPLDGVIGRVTYGGDLAPFLPLLLLGQYTHVGRGCVYGLGKYVVLRTSP